MNTGFIGDGNLARAIVLGLFEKGVVASSDIRCVSGTRATAAALSQETGIGSLELMKQSDQLPAELVDEVLTPNGVTHAFLKSLESSNWAEIIGKGIQSAVARSEELSKPAV